MICCAHTNIFSGWNPNATYMCDKPGKLGTKLFTIGGKVTKNSPPVLFGWNIAKRSVKLTTPEIISNLTRNLPARQSHHIYIDKYYTNHACMEDIIDNGHDVTGAIKRNNVYRLFHKKLHVAKTSESGVQSAHRFYRDKSTKKLHLITATTVRFIRKSKSNSNFRNNIQTFVSSSTQGAIQDDNRVDTVIDYGHHHRYIDTIDQYIRGLEFKNRLYRYTHSVFFFSMTVMALNAWSVWLQLGNARKGSFRSAVLDLASALAPMRIEDRRCVCVWLCARVYLPCLLGRITYLALAAITSWCTYRRY